MQTTVVEWTVPAHLVLAAVVFAHRGALERLFFPDLAAYAAAQRTKAAANDDHTNSGSGDGDGDGDGSDGGKAKASKEPLLFSLAWGMSPRFAKALHCVLYAVTASMTISAAKHDRNYVVVLAVTCVNAAVWIMPADKGFYAAVFYIKKVGMVLHVVHRTLHATAFIGSGFSAGFGRRLCGPGPLPGASPRRR